MLRRIIILAVLVGTLMVAAPTATPTPAHATAISVSDWKEREIRRKVGAYAGIQAYQNAPYCWGGLGPYCFDCSGLVVAAYRYAGVNLLARGIRTSLQLRAWSSSTSLRYAKTGDLLLYSGHVELVYIKRNGHKIAVSATHTGGPPVNFHTIRTRGLLKVGRVVR